MRSGVKKLAAQLPERFACIAYGHLN